MTDKPKYGTLSHSSENPDMQLSAVPDDDRSSIPMTQTQAQAPLTRQTNQRKPTQTRDSQSVTFSTTPQEPTDGDLPGSKPDPLIFNDSQDGEACDCNTHECPVSACFGLNLLGALMLFAEVALCLYIQQIWIYPLVGVFHVSLGLTIRFCLAWDSDCTRFLAICLGPATWMYHGCFVYWKHGRRNHGYRPATTTAVIV